MTHRDHFFATWADSWWDSDSTMNPLRSLTPLRFAYFDSYVSDWAGVRVLDVGCGGGYTTEFLAERGARVSGTDPSGELIAAADRHARARALDIDYSVGSAEKLPHADSTFDLVTCLDVLEHVDSPGAAVREIHRVLKPGGLFLFDTINRTLRSAIMMIWLPERVLGIVPKGAHAWRDFVTPRELRGCLAAAGFAPIGHRQGISIRGQHADGSLKARLSRDISSTYLGVARK